jgi:hypothetical protein
MKNIALKNIASLTDKSLKDPLGDSGPDGDELESDYEGESDLKPSRRSLPHKKRIPRKLKTQPARNVHTKCYKCQKCGDIFNSQSAFFSHRSTHTLPSKRSSVFSCDICATQYPNQVKFFEHLKTHYEPNLIQVTNDLQQQEQLIDYNSANQVQPVVQQTFTTKQETEQVGFTPI